MLPGSPGKRALKVMSADKVKTQTAMMSVELVKDREGEHIEIDCVKDEIDVEGLTRRVSTLIIVLSYHKFEGLC